MLSFIADVLSNFTALETLDLSHNDLKNLQSEDYNFTFPANLSSLFLSDNRLTDFPIFTVNNLSAFKVIDLQNNEIEHFDANLLNAVRSGVDLYISGK